MIIEKDIPIPPTGKGRKRKYDFSKMEVGDSFEYEGPKTTVLNAAYQWAQKYQRKAKFTIRHKDGKTRIWRTA